jgi:hypothetical protein
LLSTFNCIVWCVGALVAAINPEIRSCVIYCFSRVDHFTLERRSIIVSCRDERSIAHGEEFAKALGSFSREKVRPVSQLFFGGNPVIANRIPTFETKTFPNDAMGDDIN